MHDGIVFDSIYGTKCNHLQEFGSMRLFHAIFVQQCEKFLEKRFVTKVWDKRFVVAVNPGQINQLTD